MYNNVFLSVRIACAHNVQDGSTALMFAVQRGHGSIVQALVSCSNCDLLAKDNVGVRAK